MARLAIGSSGQFLTITSGAPAWVNSTGGWPELARTELGADATSISVTGIAARKHLMIVADLTITTSTVEIGITFNNDTGNNYNTRRSNNGGADATTLTAASLQPRGSGTSNTEHVFMVGYIYNNSASTYKSIISDMIVDKAATGAGFAPDRTEFVGRWDDTSAQITRVDLVRVSGTGNYASGSRLIVYGAD